MNRAPNNQRTRKAYRVLSSVFLGIFTAPLLSLVWFSLPWLRNFPVGDDSPHAVALPLGFFIGAALATRLNKRCSWGRVAAFCGAILLVVSILCSFGTYVKMRQFSGWDGLGWFVALVVCLHAVISGLGLFLAGVFSHLGCRERRGAIADQLV